MYGDFDNLDDLDAMANLGENEKQVKLIVRAAAFQSKNHILSYLTSPNDPMAAQDDFQMVGILSEADMTPLIHCKRCRYNLNEECNNPHHTPETLAISCGDCENASWCLRKNPRKKIPVREPQERREKWSAVKV